jgi:hypothetical protein
MKQCVQLHLGYVRLLQLDVADLPCLEITCSRHTYPPCPGSKLGHPCLPWLLNLYADIGGARVGWLGLRRIFNGLSWRVAGTGNISPGNEKARLVGLLSTSCQLILLLSYACCINSQINSLLSPMQYEQHSYIHHTIQFCCWQQSSYSSLPRDLCLRTIRHISRPMVPHELLKFRLPIRTLLMLSMLRDPQPKEGKWQRENVCDEVKRRTCIS